MKHIPILLCCFFTLTLQAQTSSSSYSPLDDITTRQLQQTERPLPYPPVREGDILWEQRVWRVIDTREKINLPFRSPEKPFATLLIEAIEAGELQAYSVEDDAFSAPIASQAVDKMTRQTDTVMVYSFETGQNEYQVVENELHPEDIKRYRIKEHWWFDTRSSSLRVRILGIAPLLEHYDDQGNFRYELPLFWINYPQSRAFLSNCSAPRDTYYQNPMSWADLLDMRKFSGTIIKVSNLQDRRLEDDYSGTELLQRARLLEQELFGQEHDAWSY